MFSRECIVNSSHFRSIEKNHRLMNAGENFQDLLDHLSAHLHHAHRPRPSVPHPGVNIQITLHGAEMVCSTAYVAMEGEERSLQPKSKTKPKGP